MLAMALAGPDAVDPGGPTVHAAPPGSGAIPEEVLRVARQVADRPLAARMDAISEALLGRPYLADPLGEGAGVDPDPFARYDAFDCLTFVEEVLALALAGDPAHAAEVRNSLRYGDAPPSYTSRRHFMELQWIPGVIADGWVRDTTGDYGPTVHLERTWTLADWRNWAGRARFHHPDEALPVGRMALDVLPLDAARAAADRFRPGSILLTVREDRPYKPLWVTHVGLVFEDGDHLVLRHATKLGSGGTRDHDLGWYLDHVATYAPWKTLGVAVLEPVEAGPRRAR